MTRVAEGVLLSLWIHASEQRSVSRRYSRVIIRSYDKNFSIPFVQVIGSKLGLPREIKHALVWCMKTFLIRSEAIASLRYARQNSVSG
jgi:hypothetical protein